jgi:DDE superfamily endonuclease
VLDGTLIAVGRVAEGQPSYSGKYKKNGMSLQVISSPLGDILRVPGPLPGSVHDLTAARIRGVIRQLAATGLITLAGKGYIGAGQHVLFRTRGRGKLPSRKAASSAHARLRAPAERASARAPSSRPGRSCASSLLPLESRADRQGYAAGSLTQGTG